VAEVICGKRAFIHLGSCPCGWLRCRWIALRGGDFPRMSYLLHGSGCGRCGWRPREGARCDGGSVEFEPTPTGGGDAVLPRHPQPSTRWARAGAAQADPTTPAASCRAKSRCLAQCLTRERGLLDFDEIVFRIAIELKLTDVFPVGPGIDALACLEVELDPVALAAAADQAERVAAVSRPVGRGRRTGW
jgi:hypothetical protein